MGTTGGGLWKTDNMGISWRNVSDGFFKTGTVGAVAVAESDPNVVYVGMGEHAVRGVMTHQGDGVYRSTDAGKTWKHIGLEPTQHISRIVVHPKDPDTVLVAAQGALYSPSAERGVFKSTDGGATWKKVLFVNDKTGAAELSMDATNPRILYAAMWEHGRRPWQVISGGPGSGLYKSTDTGETWEKMTEGLPEQMGKMAIAVSPSNSETVYALIESDSAKDDRGLYVSTNAGKKWTQVTSEPRLVQRAWYYTELFVDPKDDQHDLRVERPGPAIHRRGEDLEDPVGHARRFPRPVDQPRQSPQLHHLERRRLGDHLRQRQDLELPGYTADGAVLPDQRGQPVPVPHLRRPAGQHVGGDREPRARQRGHHAGELESVGRRRKRIPGLRSRQPPLRDGRQLPGHDRRVWTRRRRRARTSWRRRSSTSAWTPRT